MVPTFAFALAQAMEAAQKATEGVISKARSQIQELTDEFRALQETQRKQGEKMSKLESAVKGLKNKKRGPSSDYHDVIRKYLNSENGKLAITEAMSGVEFNVDNDVDQAFRKMLEPQVPERMRKPSMSSQEIARLAIQAMVEGSRNCKQARRMRVPSILLTDVLTNNASLTTDRCIKWSRMVWILDTTCVANRCLPGKLPSTAASVPPVASTQVIITVTLQE